MDHIYRNKKTGNLYVHVRDVINATNAQDGQKMIMYMPLLKSGMFVREEVEFNEKFEKMVEE